MSYPNINTLFINRKEKNLTQKCNPKIEEIIRCMERSNTYMTSLEESYTMKYYMNTYLEYDIKIGQKPHFNSYNNKPKASNEALGQTFINCSLGLINKCLSGENQ